MGFGVAVVVVVLSCFAEFVGTNDFVATPKDFVAVATGTQYMLENQSKNSSGVPVHRSIVVASISIFTGMS